MSLLKRVRQLLRLHDHEWHDWYVFDSSAEVSTGDGSHRVVGQQIMQLCRCGQTQRRHLRTWREARIARKLLPYKRWGVWSFSLQVPHALGPTTPHHTEQGKR